MDAFRTLTGGSRFNRTRFAGDIGAFEKNPVASSSAALPAELDFFGTAPAPSEKAVAKKNKKRRRVEEAALTEVVTVDYPALLRKHKIKFTGLEPPNPILALAQLANCPPCVVANWEKMGLSQPTAVQMASWGIILEKRDALVCAPTGSGKTLAFMLPLLVDQAPGPEDLTKVQRPTSLILEPTRELAMQVWRETTSLAQGGGWSVKVLGEEERASGAAKKEKKGKKGKGKKVEPGAETTGDAPDEVAEVAVEEVLRSPVDILITTPLRLIYAIKAKTVDLTNVRHLILDEADKLFELNFIEQTDEIIAACSHPELRKGMFSATMPSGVEELAKSVMSGGGVGLIRAIIGQKDAATETIAQSLQFVGEEDHKLLALRTLIAQGAFTPPVLIFVQSILRAKELAAELLFDGVNADCIHADRTSEERDDVVRGFAEGKIWCLISTDVMGRGVDFKGVKLVINYDFPQSGGSYIHRIGRTGRAGKAGKAVTFFTKEDAPHLKSIVNVMKASGCDVPQFMLDMKNPSQREKKQLKMKPLNRKDVRQTNGAGNTKSSDTRAVQRKRLMGGKVVKGKARDVGMEE